MPEKKPKHETFSEAWARREAEMAHLFGVARQPIPPRDEPPAFTDDDRAVLKGFGITLEPLMASRWPNL